MSSVTDKSINKTTDSSTEVKEFFNSYYSKKISFTSNQVDSVVGFFKKRGFETSSATATATILLEQSKIDNVNIFKLLDTLEGLSDIAISQLVATILNNNRSKVSSIGYKVENTGLTTEYRNIIL
jgi:hypothetical protein